MDSYRLVFFLKIIIHIIIPARKVFSRLPPFDRFFNLVLTNAEPFPEIFKKKIKKKLRRRDDTLLEPD